MCHKEVPLMPSKLFRAIYKTHKTFKSQDKSEIIAQSTIKNATSSSTSSTAATASKTLHASYKSIIRRLSILLNNIRNVCPINLRRSRGIQLDLVDQLEMMMVCSFSRSNNSTNTKELKLNRIWTQLKCSH